MSVSFSLKDMVAFSCCEYDGGEEEKREMDIARERSWRGKFRKRGRVIRPGANRVDGKCPLTPLEVLNCIELSALPSINLLFNKFILIWFLVKYEYLLLKLCFVLLKNKFLKCCANTLQFLVIITG